MISASRFLSPFLLQLEVLMREEWHASINYNSSPDGCMLLVSDCPFALYALRDGL